MKKYNLDLSGYNVPHDMLPTKPEERTDSLYIGSTGIRVSQALSMVLALISFILLVVNARRQHKPEELYVNRVAASAAASESPAEETESNKEE